MSHTAVMSGEVVSFLLPHDGGTYLDATFGGGGHSARLLGAACCRVFAIDRDPKAIARGTELAARYPDRLSLLEGCFSTMLELLARAGVADLDGVVMDFGVSSFQLEDASRGFSFRLDGPLDMRMGQHGPTAADLINEFSTEELVRVLGEFGEERHARRIARAIVAERAKRPIATTVELARIIRRATPFAPGRIDPATRSFQALRIRVNDELAEIGKGLAQAASLLRPEGRLVAIAFHSLEDRLVKRFMAEVSGNEPQPSRHAPPSTHRGKPRFRLLTKRPLRPSAVEVVENPRARSARLRAIERLAEAA